MRLFVAFDVPEDVSDHLLSVQKSIEFDGKATLTRTFHLTLKFLGEADEERLSILVDELSNISFRPFEAQLSEVGVFPDHSNPRVLWAGLEPHDVINALQQQVEDATIRAGFDPDRRFHPHLTLARIRFVNDDVSFKDMFDSLKLEPMRFPVFEFKLYRSTLTPQGPEYEVLKGFQAGQ